MPHVCYTSNYECDVRCLLTVSLFNLRHPQDFTSSQQRPEGEPCTITYTIQRTSARAVLGTEAHFGFGRLLDTATETENFKVGCSVGYST